MEEASGAVSFTAVVDGRGAAAGGNAAAGGAVSFTAVVDGGGSAAGAADCDDGDGDGGDGPDKKTLDYFSPDAALILADIDDKYSRMRNEWGCLESIERVVEPTRGLNKAPRQVQQVILLQGFLKSTTPGVGSTPDFRRVWARVFGNVLNICLQSIMKDVALLMEQAMAEFHCTNKEFIQLFLALTTRVDTMCTVYKAFVDDPLLWQGHVKPALVIE
jgi:hypothetical protein